MNRLMSASKTICPLAVWSWYYLGYGRVIKGGISKKTETKLHNVQQTTDIDC